MNRMRNASGYMQKTANGSCMKHSVCTVNGISLIRIKHHSTVKDACELAEKLHVKNLLLYHTEDKNISVRKQRYAEEGRQYCHGNLLIPDDLEALEL